MNQAGIIPSSAFLAVPRMRRASVEAGTRAVGAQAWQCCRHLRVVRMPSTAVRIAENTCSTALQYQALSLDTKRLRQWTRGNNAERCAAVNAGVQRPTT